MSFHLLNTFHISLSNLWENKFQGSLATLGVIVGSATLIATLSVSEGVKRQVIRDIEALGTNLIFIRGQSLVETSPVQYQGRIQALTTEDVDLLYRECPEIEYASPQILDQVIVSYRNKSIMTNLEGTTPESSIIRNWRIHSGRFLMDRDIRDNRKICVLGYTLSTVLYHQENPVGNTIILDNTPYSVIGVMEPKGNVLNIDYDDRIIIPLSSAMHRYGTRNKLDAIIVQSKSSEQVPELIGKLNKILLHSHGAQNFRVWSQEGYLKQRQKVLISFQILMGSLSVISLIVGGIGIMNIMLASVYNRIREIGIRKAVGAKSIDIIGQFLTESIMISVAGGILGILLGYFLGSGVSKLFARNFSLNEPWVSVFSLKIVMISFIFAFSIGIIFGLYPAIRASKLNPVDALRYE